MANILEENHKKLVALGENYFSSEKCDEREKEAYFTVLSRLYRNALSNTSEEVALVIGFDESGEPVSWYPEKENLFSFCKCGYGNYLYGLDIAFLDIALRYPKEKIQYFGFYGDSVPYTVIDNGQRLECGMLWSADSEEGITATMKAVRSCIEERERMKKRQLQAEPLIFLNVVVPLFIWDDALFVFLCEVIPKLQRLKMAVYLSDYTRFLDTEVFPQTLELSRICKETPHALLLGEIGNPEKVLKSPLMEGVESVLSESYRNSIFKKAILYRNGRQTEMYFLNYIAYKVLTRQA